MYVSLLTRSEADVSINTTALLDPKAQSFRQENLVCDRAAVWDVQSLPNGIKNAYELWSVEENSLFHLTPTGRVKEGVADPLVTSGLLEKLVPNNPDTGETVEWRGVIWAGKDFDVLVVRTDHGRDFLVPARYRPLFEHVADIGGHRWFIDNLESRVHLVRDERYGPSTWVGTAMLASSTWRSIAD